MEISAARPQRLLPLRIAAVLLLIASAYHFTQVAVGRYDLLAAYPALTEKLIATMLTFTFLGAVALAFLAFARQRFGLWIALACLGFEFAIETWAGFPLLRLVVVPLAAALLFVAARRAWPELQTIREPT